MDRHFRNSLIADKDPKLRVAKEGHLYSIKYPDLTPFQARIVWRGKKRGKEWLKLNHKEDYKAIAKYL